ncbi:MAG: GDSL-type esterase/lipase family protein [Rikenellaceae bacterium]
MIRFKILLVLLALGSMTVSYGQKIRVACVGNSVTYGAGIEDRERDSYPSQLQRLLGDDYEVRNFGKSGATLLRRGHRPYNEQEECEAALAFAADRVIIHLGLNDTDPRNWPHYRDDFVCDYMALVDSFRAVNPRCEIWVCRMTPISSRHSRFKSGTRDWYWQIQETIEQMAHSEGLTLIDLQEGLYSRPELLPDGLHPDAEGAGIIAQRVYGALTGDFGGLQMSPFYGSNMVLQRDRPLRISGVADAGELVTLSFAGQTRLATADLDGRWKVSLDALSVGEPRKMVVHTDDRELVFENVLVGELWLCSGQSNMEFELSAASTSAEGIAQADHLPAPLRIYNMQEIWRTDDVVWSASALDSLDRHIHYHPTRWEECSSETVSDFSAVAYYFGRALSDSLGVPVGLISNAVGGAPAEAWIDRKTLEFELPDILSNWRSNDMIQEWVRGRATKNIENRSSELQRHPYEPSYMFETAIEPLRDFTLAGAIWYQGESNAHNIELYEVIFPLLVRSWRGVFGADFPINTVQLSSLNRPSWTWFRDSQRRLAESIEGVGMVVSSDVGDSLDVHPRYKEPVGERLALLALHDNYGWSHLTPMGPMFRSVEAQGEYLFVEFDYSDGLTSLDGMAIRSFEIGDTFGYYHPAVAEVVDGKIRLHSDMVARPCYVRYGWQPFTRANLVNSCGLPASTFKAEL